MAPLPEFGVREKPRRCGDRDQVVMSFWKERSTELAQEWRLAALVSRFLKGVAGFFWQGLKYKLFWQNNLYFKHVLKIQVILPNYLAF